MPLTFTVTEGILPAGEEKLAFSRLSNAMLRWHGLSDNALAIANTTGTIHIAPRNTTFTGMQETPVVMIEWKVPSFAFTTRDIQRGYFEEATNIIHEMSGGKQPKDRIFINVVYAVDGAWNFGGKAMTNDEIANAYSKA